MNVQQGPIGVFDSGYGGLTVFREIVAQLPEYDYLYLGDNARVPYGSRSFETVYDYTRECVWHLFDKGCSLVVLACNTASAKALRSIQQQDLPKLDPAKRVLGVIRPTAEEAGSFTRTGHIGILATTGTVASLSYVLEIEKLFPQVSVYQQACPMWVPLVENDEYRSAGADYFIRQDVEKLMTRHPGIDAIILGCTHYPLLQEKIANYVPQGTRLISQGPIVAKKLADYLDRHPEVRERCSTGGGLEFYTTESPESFDRSAALFYGQPVTSRHLQL